MYYKLPTTGTDLPISFDVPVPRQNPQVLRKRRLRSPGATGVPIIALEDSSNSKNGISCQTLNEQPFGYQYYSASSSTACSTTREQPFTYRLPLISTFSTASEVIQGQPFSYQQPSTASSTTQEQPFSYQHPSTWTASSTTQGQPFSYQHPSTWTASSTTQGQPCIYQLPWTSTASTIIQGQPFTYQHPSTSNTFSTTQGQPFTYQHPSTSNTFSTTQGQPFTYQHPSTSNTFSTQEQPLSLSYLNPSTSKVYTATLGQSGSSNVSSSPKTRLELETNNSALEWYNSLPLSEPLDLSSTSSKSGTTKTTPMPVPPTYMPLSIACGFNFEQTGGQIVKNLVEYLQANAVFVNAKQYHRILKRREMRAKLMDSGRIPKDRKKYLHESRHIHAKKRVRGSKGQFFTKVENWVPVVPKEDHDDDATIRDKQPRMESDEDTSFLN